MRSYRMNVAARSAPPTTMSPPGFALSSMTSSGTTSRTTVVFQSARSASWRTRSWACLARCGRTRPPAWDLRGPCRPVSGHQFVGDTSVQEGAHRAELLVEVTVHLVVDQVPVELAVGSLKETVKRTDL